MTGYEDVDIAVIGAGPAGAAAAITAARQGAKVILIGPAKPDDGFEQSVGPPGIAVLERLGAGSAGRRGWFTGILGPHGPQMFGVNQAGDAIGAHIDRRQMDAALRASARAAGARYRDSEVARIDSAVASFCVTCRDGTRLIAARLILATGRARHLGRQLGMRSKRCSPPLLVSTGRRRIDGPDAVMARFLPQPHGWLWVAPLGNGLASWTSLARAGTIAAARLAKAGRMTAATWLLASPAGGPGWMAVGDAVCALDPSWGRGILWALTSGEAAGRYAAARLAADIPRCRELELQYRREIHALAVGEVTQLAARTAGFDARL
ncbi:MAG: FAD-dependent oxidoreductase [Dongiaceae bacterium]